MNASLSGLSNRASAQIRRRFRAYLINKKSFTLKSSYVRYLQEKVFPKYNQISLKNITIPLLASFLVTDGHVTVRKKKELDVLELGFSNKNIELVNAFNDLIYITFGEVPSSIAYGEIVRTRYVASWHMPMVKELIGYAFLNGKKDVSKLLNLNKDILFECFRIAMSCDGFVSFWVAKETYLHNKSYYRIRGSLELGCKPIVLRSQWRRIAEILDLNFNLEIDRIKCKDYNSMERFYGLGGFVPGTLICGDSEYYEGIEKSKLLDALLRVKREGRNNIVSAYDVGKLLRQRVTEIVK